MATFTTVGELKAFLATISDDTLLATSRPFESFGNSLDVDMIEVVTMRGAKDDIPMTVSSTDGFWKDKKIKLRSEPFTVLTFR